MLHNVKEAVQQKPQNTTRNAASYGIGGGCDDFFKLLAGHTHRPHDAVVIHSAGNACIDGIHA